MRTFKKLEEKDASWIAEVSPNEHFERGFGGVPNGWPKRNPPVSCTAFYSPMDLYAVAGERVLAGQFLRSGPDGRVYASTLQDDAVSFYQALGSAEDGDMILVRQI